MTIGHIISFLPEDDPLVLKEKKIPGRKEFHQFVITEEDKENEIKMAISIRNQVNDLPIRVGNEVSVVSNLDQPLQELATVCFLQRRLYESIKVFVVRPTGRQFIPYITSLTENESDKLEGMVDYNYSTGGCGGNCSSCG